MSMNVDENSMPSTGRRHWLMAGTAAAAVVAGAGVAWWRQSGGQAEAPLAAASPPTAAEAAVWALALETPAGSPIALRDFQGKPLLLNFWATWCPPCIEELPLLNSFYSENKSKGWQVLGLAVDQKAPVNTFLSRLPLAFPVAMAGMGGVELSKSLGNLVGGLPFTVVFGAAGTVLHRKMGRVSPQDLSGWAKLQ